MKRTIATVTAALALVTASAAPAAAAVQATKLRVAWTVIQCASFFHERQCYPLVDAKDQTAMLYRWTAHDETVIALCTEHRRYTHAWRVAFCTGRMPLTTSSTFGDAEMGVVDRAHHALGQPVIGSGNIPS